MPAGADVRIWDGGGADSEWATAGNWDPDGYVNSDNLTVFSGSPTSTVDVYADNGGTITLDGPAAVANFSKPLYIAYTGGTCRMDVLNGADVSNTDGYLGQASGSSGTATVSGVGSTWTNSSELNVGFFGTGALNITNGGAVSTTNGCLGLASGSMGTATVSDAGSGWTISGDLRVGSSGHGTLNITNGGVVSNTNGWLGRNSGSMGTATVSDAWSKWTNSGILYVGGNGIGVLDILNGGAVSNTDGYLGQASGSSGTVTVSGTGSEWFLGNGVSYVGYYGTGVLSITGGGTVTNRHSSLGYASGGLGTATVSEEASDDPAELQLTPTRHGLA